MTRTLRLLTLFLGSAMAAIAAGEKTDEKAAVLDAAQERAKVKRTDADFQAITAALQMYKLNSGAYPTEKQGLKALVDKPAEPPLPRRWVKLMAKVPLDPWEREYSLVVRKEDGKDTFYLVSKGRDAEDPADDLSHPLEKPAAKE
jgi:general secretion pathway protein G